MQIKGGSLVLFQSPVGKAGGNVRLVRRFIFRKSRVPIDTIEADFGAGHDFGCKLGEFGSQRVDQFDHGLLNAFLISLLV